MELLERSSELARGQELLARVAGGDGQALALVGPGGIGKTTLLAAVRDHARASGVTTCLARGSTLDQDLPFGIARQLLEPALVRAQPDERRHLLRGAASLAEPLVTDDLSRAEPAPGVTTGFAALHGLHWLVANLAEDKPVLLAVDDAHWADTESLRFFAHLSARLEGLPVLLAITARPAAPQAEAGPLQQMISDPQTTVLRPTALSAEAVHDLVARRLGPEADSAFSTACHNVTGGNPFLIRELLVSLSADGVKPDSASAPKIASLGPTSISRAVLTRLARMTPGNAALARAVAVLGSQARFDDAAQLAGLDQATAGEANDALVRAEVLHPGDPLDFVHPIVRSSVYEDMAPGARADAHAQAARLVDARHAEATEVATHLLAARPAGDAWAVQRLRQAASWAAGRGASGVAVTYLERALAEPPPAPARAGVLYELGAALLLRHDHQRGVEVLTEALQAGDDASQRALIARALGSVLALQPGSARESVELLDRAIAALPETERELGLELEADIASSGFVSLEARRAAVARSPRFSDPQRLAFQAHAALRHAMYEGPATDSRPLVRRALADGTLLVQQTADSPTYWQAVLALLFAQDLTGAHLVASQGMDEATSRGSALGAGLAACFLSRAAFQLGELSQAEAEGRRYVELLGDALAVGPAFLVDALVARGELDEAERALTRFPASRHGTELSMFHFLLVSRGQLRLAQGDIESGLSDLYECGRGLDIWDAASPWVKRRTPGSIQWRPQAAEALAGSGEQVEARRLIETELEACRAFGAPTCLGITLRVAGVVEQGDAGADLLAESVDTLAATPARLEHARALVDLGAALRRLGHRTEARSPLREGLARARRCGATPLAERAHQELCASGAQPRKIVRSGIEALTASERRIAEMAARGMGNREIAQSLFVTVRTVETHLGHAYQKLDMRSRQELSKELLAASI